MRSTNEVKELLDSRVLLPLWPETGNILGLCRNATYDAAARGDIKTVQFGRLKRVPSAWLKAKLGLDEPTAWPPSHHHPDWPGPGKENAGPHWRANPAKGISP